MATRLDAAVAEQLGVTRSQARALIMEGRVRINGAPATKPGSNVREGAVVEIERPRRFVSRGGEKLDAAIGAFDLDVTGLYALDIGASTGGFTSATMLPSADNSSTARATIVRSEMNDVSMTIRSNGRSNVPGTR